MNPATPTRTPSPTETEPAKLDKPEFLLVLVVSFMLWSIGFVDLLTHLSGNPETAIFGLYSPPVFIILIAYSALLIPWFMLLLAPRAHLSAPQKLTILQARGWLASSLLLIFIGISWSLFALSAWANYPGLRAAIFFFLLFMGAIVLFSGWNAATKQRWRKLFLAPLLLLLLVEIGAQIGAYVGWLPAQTRITNLFVQYGRVYQNEEGRANARVNNYGWYYPDFAMQKDAPHIVLLGDTFVQALQINPQAHMGIGLQMQIRQQAEQVLSSPISTMHVTQEQSKQRTKTEVLALGMPGFGPGLYLSDTRLQNMIDEFTPQEVILFFHLSNDFQIANEPALYELVYQLNADGAPEIHPDSWRHRHDLQHFILPGYGFMVDPLATLQSNFLTTRLFMPQRAAASQPTPADMNPWDIPHVQAVVVQTAPTDTDYTAVKAIDLIQTPGRSNFIFEAPANEAAEHSYAIARALLKNAHELLVQNGIALRLVSVPAFPPAFYDPTLTGADGRNWSPQIGNYDLFQPERMLAQFAQDESIPFLATGQQMHSEQLTAKQIQALFFRQGTGHLTEAGHGYMAQLIYDCFYGGSADRCGAAGSE